MRLQCLLVIAAAAASLVACMSDQTPDITGSYECSGDHSLEVIIEEIDGEYAATVVRDSGVETERQYTCRIEKPAGKHVILWANPEHTVYFRVTESSVGLKGFWYDDDKQSVTRILLTRSGQLAGGAR